MAELQKFPLFMDVKVSMFSERMSFEVFYDLAPSAAENFLSLCEELQKFPLFMDVKVSVFSERMSFEVFYDLAPSAAENFLSLCEGINPRTKYLLWYANCFFRQRLGKVAPM